MRQDHDRTRRTGGGRKAPLDAAALEALATAYVARYATSAGKLAAYCRRKLRERGWADEDAPAPVEALVARFAERGWVDDAGWGRMRREGLLARGYGARRIDQALRAGGIAEPLRERLLPGEGEALAAALRYAAKRRFGPFGDPPPADPAARARARQKQLAAMVRAGHDFAAAARIVDAADAEEVAQWLED